MSILQAESYAVVRQLVSDVEELSSDERNRVLWYACDGGDLSMVKSVIRAGCDVDHFHRGHTPLMMASIGGHDDVVKELILAGCKVDLRSEVCFVGWLGFIIKTVRAWPALVVWAVSTLFLLMVPNGLVQIACCWLLTLAVAFFNEPFKMLRMKSWTKVMGYVAFVLAVILVWKVAGIMASVTVVVPGIAIWVWTRTEEEAQAAALMKLVGVTVTLAMIGAVALTGAEANAVVEAIAGTAGVRTGKVTEAVALAGTVVGALAGIGELAVAMVAAAEIMAESDAGMVAVSVTMIGAAAVMGAVTVAWAVLDIGAGTGMVAAAVAVVVPMVVAVAVPIAVAEARAVAGAVPRTVALIVTVTITVAAMIGVVLRSTPLANIFAAMPLLGIIMKTRTLSGTGMTALHYAAWYDHITCGTHLVEGGANMLAENTYFRTPSHVCFHRFRAAVQHSLYSSSKRVIVMMGSSKYGKSTLIAALQSESRTLFQSLVYKFGRVNSVTKQTAGIKAVPFLSAKYGKVLFYDFAGRSDYHVPHQPFLEAMLSKPGVSVTLLLLVKVTEKEDVIRQQLIRWLQPVALACISSNPEVHVIVIGSFLDQIKSRKMAHQKLQGCTKLVQDEYPSLKVQEFFLLDCREPESAGMEGLRSCLQQTQSTLPYLPVLSYNVDWVMSQLQKACLNKQCIQLTTFRVWLQDNAQNLPTNLPPPEEVCQDLSAAGCILFLRNKQDLSQSWLILDLPTILHDVYGTLFSPDQDRVNQFGLLHCTHLSELFPKLDPKMIPEVLITLEFCIRVDPLPLKEEMISLTEKDEVGGWLYFPALVSAKAPEVFTPDPQCLHWACWQLKTDDKQIILAHLLQGIILGIAATHIFIEKDLPPSVRKHCCSVWRNGISWRSTTGVDVAVQISDSSIVQVLGRSMERPDELYRYVSTVTQCIFKTIANWSPALKSMCTPYIIHPCTYVGLDETLTPILTRYPVASIIRSVAAKDPLVHSQPITSDNGSVNYSTVSLQELFGGWQPTLHVVQCLKELKSEWSKYVTGSCTVVYIRRYGIAI